MVYTQAAGRQFWLDFDQHFKFSSGTNGLAQKYNEMGGYDAPGAIWHAAISAGQPQQFVDYVQSVKQPLSFISEAQKAFINKYFPQTEDLARAFQDFAFGILASPNAPNRQGEPVHTMNGGLGARDYLSWHGCIEGALLLFPADAFWTNLRWISGMAWELQVKARPQEVFPNMNEPLPNNVTNAIRAKWEARSPAEITEEFRNYDTRPNDWAIGV